MHMVILLMLTVVVVIVVVVVAISAGSKSKQSVGPDGMYAPPVQIGYAMDGQPIYQQQAQPGVNTFAVLALVLGFFIGILGIIFGHVARSQIRRTGERGNGLALAGLILGYGSFAVVALLFLPRLL